MASALHWEAHEKMTPNHQKFINHLERSSEAVLKAAVLFTDQGYDVVVKGKRKAPSHVEWKDYSDGGDLFIQERFEVKRLSVEFSGKQDWPFGEKFIVCAKHSFDLAQPKPRGYIIFNQGMTVYAFVSRSTFKFWYMEQRCDSRYEGEEAVQDFYFCPLEYVAFRRIQ